MAYFSIKYTYTKAKMKNYLPQSGRNALSNYLSAQLNELPYKQLQAYRYELSYTIPAGEAIFFFFFLGNSL